LVIINTSFINNFSVYGKDNITGFVAAGVKIAAGVEYPVLRWSMGDKPSCNLSEASGGSKGCFGP
jgi:hypothetical protein